MEIGGHGTILNMATVAAPTVFTKIAQRVSIGTLSAANGRKDDTDLDDPNKKSSATIPDFGELPLTINYDPGSATHATLWALFLSGDEVNWELILNDHATEASRSKAAISGWVQAFQPTGFETESNVTADLTIVINSITITARAS